MCFNDEREVYLAKSAKKFPSLEELLQYLRYQTLPLNCKFHTLLSLCSGCWVRVFLPFRFPYRRKISSIPFLCKLYTDSYWIQWVHLPKVWTFHVMLFTLSLGETCKGCRGLSIQLCSSIMDISGAMHTISFTFFFLIYYKYIWIRGIVWTIIFHFIGF